MRLFPSDPQRLRLLNQAQPDRPWKSCDEKRRCITCDRTFRGASVDIRTGRGEAIRLGCPGCQSAPDFWVRAGNPLLDDTAWADWQTVLDDLQEHENTAR